jgi:hypothetical protein
MYFYGLFLAIRAGSLTYFSALNPAMKYGGAFRTSKFAILSQLPAEFRPGGILLPAGTGTEWVFREIEKAGLKFPLVAKPDIGERGKGVELLKTRDEMVRYLGEHGGDIILQEYIDLPCEFGILYFRYPDSSREEISSNMIRDFLVVEGDGRSSLEELIKRNPRALFRKKYLLAKFGTGFMRFFPVEKYCCWNPSANTTAEPVSWMATISWIPACSGWFRTFHPIWTGFIEDVLT